MQSVSFSLLLILFAVMSRTLLSGQDQQHSSHRGLQAEFKSQNKPACDGAQRFGHSVRHKHTLSLLGTTSTIHAQKPTITLPKAILPLRSVSG
jgi:hypothetical protein